MSIWATRLVMGGEWDEGPAPIIYRRSHVIPNLDDPRGGSVDTAHIPAFIARGGYDEMSHGEDDPWWPFLRLSVVPEAALSVRQWKRLHAHADEVHEADVELAEALRQAADVDATVVLDVEQVDALIADLTAWRAGADENRR